MTENPSQKKGGTQDPLPQNSYHILPWEELLPQGKLVLFAKTMGNINAKCFEMNPIPTSNLSADTLRYDSQNSTDGELKINDENCGPNTSVWAYSQRSTQNEIIRTVQYFQLPIPIFLTLCTVDISRSLISIFASHLNLSERFPIQIADKKQDIKWDN